MLQCHTTACHLAVLAEFVEPEALFNMLLAAVQSAELGLLAAMLLFTHCTLCCSLFSKRTRLEVGAEAPLPEGLRKAVKLSRFCWVGMMGKESSVVKTLQA